MESESRLVLITAPDMEWATQLGRAIVEKRLAACVQLLPGIISMYTWEGRLHEEGEVLLLVKTSQQRIPEIETFLAGEHPYDTPECIAFAPSSIEPRYAAWLGDWTADRGGEV